MVAVLLGLDKDIVVNYIVRIAYKVNSFNLKLFCNIDLEVRGKIPDYPCIIVSNHQSIFDIFLIFSLVRLPRMSSFVMRQGVQRRAYLKLYIWLFDMIILNPNNSLMVSMREIIKHAKFHILEKKRSIVLFPEGTRVSIGKSVKYKKGILLLYKLGIADIVPVALNCGVCWQKGSYFRRPGKIIIQFLDVIKPNEYTEGEFLELLQYKIESVSSKLISEAQEAQSSRTLCYVYNLIIARLFK